MTPLLYKYTDAELKQLLKSITVIIDTREKEIEHITSYFEAKKIPYTVSGLEFGDYSYFIPANSDLGIQRDIYFSNSLIIERKAHLEELSGNLAQNRERFENEFLRAKDCKIMLMVEHGSFSDIYNHKYKTQLSEKAFIASVMALTHRYNINVSFVDLGTAGAFIYQNCFYHCREFIKNG